MIGLYSFLNLKEDNLRDIRVIQSDEYFKEANLEYINSRRKILSLIFKNHRRIILNENIKENNLEAKSFTKEDLKTFLLIIFPIILYFVKEIYQYLLIVYFNVLLKKCFCFY